MATAGERSAFVGRAGRWWRRSIASVREAYSARRRKKRFFARLRDDVFALVVLVLAAWIAVNLIAHLTN